MKEFINQTSQNLGLKRKVNNSNTPPLTSTFNYMYSWKNKNKNLFSVLLN